MFVSQRGKMMPASPIRKLAPLADEAKNKGIHVYHLNIGQPDIPTPEEFYEAIKKFNEPVLSYGPTGGIVELRLAVVDYLKQYGISIELDEVWITIGGSEAILLSFLATADPDDEFIIFEPFYTNYNGLAIASSVKLVPIRLSVEEGFRLPPQKKIESYITNRTRGIIICTPNNPTGTVFTKEEMFILERIVKKYNIILISDEVYREFVYDGKEHISALTLPNIQDKVIVVDSISKRFSACGARIGFIISRNKEIMRTILKFTQARLCPPTIEQVGAVALFKNMYKFIKPMIAEYDKRRNVLYERLKKIEGVTTYKPEGAFYTIAKLPIDDSDRFSAWLLSEFSEEGKTVMLAPASGFYGSPGAGVDEVRLAYILNENDIKDALDKLAIALKRYPQRR